ncbi:hypothetical protein P4H71_09315 [Paenibacillus kribbensis]|uniref:hypothetical protein n=1 Tax=Paenibacillus kribbensis TaxID=172713 RepID=UPI002DC03CED|nr:hypothetical protein [Paenibacillus kribbensis]MEC0234525.1 hypothetical protein [Paenibacillus kribbensis]
MIIGKKFIFVAVVLSFVIFLVSFQPGVYAEADIMSNPQLDDLAEKYDVEFVPLNDNKLEAFKEAGMEIKNFKDLDEYESFLADVKRDIDDKIDTTQEFSLEVPERETSSISLASQNNYTINWYAPMAGGLAGLMAWKNVAVVYDYEYQNNWPYFTGVSSIKSYLSGLQVAVSWEQLNATKTYSTKCRNRDTANFKINGYYLLGAEVQGVPIGVKINDTWNTSLTLNPSGAGCF